MVYKEHLNKKGKSVKHNFEEEYGKEKGDRYFYGYENEKKHKKFKRETHSR